MNEVAAIIIAAGASSRLGEPKQLLLVEGETLLGRAVRIAKEAGADPVLVILGANRERIEAEVDLSGVRVVGNNGWQEGLASSIRLGVEEVQNQPTPASGVLLAICDQPAVTSEHLARMIETFREQPASAVASTYAGKRGIPAVFPRSAFVDLLALTGDQGARGLLSQADRKVIEMPLAGGELDIDRPADLIHLRSGKPMQYLG